MAHDTSPTPDPGENPDLLTRSLDFPVVGLGATAGGLAALALFINPCASRFGHGLRGGGAPFAQAQKRCEGFDAHLTKPLGFDALRKTGADLQRHTAQPPGLGTAPDAGPDA